MTWDGADRRVNGQKDHDLLIAIKVIVSENAKTVDGLKIDFNTHKDDNVKSFRIVANDIFGLRLQWAKLGGALAVVMIIIELIFKLWK